MSDDIEAIATDIVDSAIKVHKALGPGLLESAYQQCLAHEFRKHGRNVKTEVIGQSNIIARKLTQGIVSIYWLITK